MRASRELLLLTGYLAEYLTHFHQTYTSDALWDRDDHVTFWCQKVKGQGHGGIQYAGNSNFSFHNSSGWRHAILDNLASSYIHLSCISVIHWELLECVN